MKSVKSVISISEISDFSEINVSKFKNTKYQYFIMFKCNHCSYQVDYKQNLTRHEKSKHRNNIPPTIVSVCENVEPASGNNQSNVAPTTQYGMEPTSHYESISAEIYPCEDTPKVSTAIDVDMQHGLGIARAQDNQSVPIEGYNNIINETYKWKDAYEGQNQVNIMKDNAIKIRDMHLLKSNEKIAAMGKDMGKLIHKYENLKTRKLNKRDNKNDQRGYGMEDDSSEYGYGDTDEETVDDSEHSDTEEFDGKVDYDMDSENGDIVDSEGSDEESMDDSEQSEYMNRDQEMDNEIVNRSPTSVFKSINTSTYLSRILKKGTRAPNKVYVYEDGRHRCSGVDVNGNEVEFTYGTRYYKFPTGAGIGGLLRARFSRGIGGLLKGC